jgi:uncharacterized protein (DUF362 family)
MSLDGTEWADSMNGQILLVDGISSVPGGGPNKGAFFVAAPSLV